LISSSSDEAEAAEVAAGEPPRVFSDPAEFAEWEDFKAAFYGVATTMVVDMLWVAGFMDGVRKIRPEDFARVRASFVAFKAFCDHMFEGWKSEAKALSERPRNGLHTNKHIVSDILFQNDMPLFAFWALFWKTREATSRVIFRDVFAGSGLDPEVYHKLIVNDVVKTLATTTCHHVWNGLSADPDDYQSRIIDATKASRLPSLRIYMLAALRQKAVCTHTCFRTRKIQQEAKGAGKGEIQWKDVQNKVQEHLRREQMAFFDANTGPTDNPYVALARSFIGKSVGGKAVCPKRPAPGSEWAVS
jgi:hypothetical protein